jgi:hypothetical protein
VSDDPTVIRSLAVTREDVVRALELRERGGRRGVLRVTPPFAGRMRARLHVEGTEGDYGDPAPLHVDPARLVRDPPPFPSVDAAEDRLRERGRYSVEAQRERHARAVAGWRRTVGARVAEEATVATPAGPHRVAVAVLG